MAYRCRYLVYPVRTACRLTVEPEFPVSVDQYAKYEMIIRPFSGLKVYGLRHAENGPSAEDAAFFALPSL